MESLLECDDEYWLDANSNPVFEQPPGQPSKIAFFNSWLRVKQIHAFTLRTVVRGIYATNFCHADNLAQYAINRSKVAFGRAGPQWEQDIISEIDSALNAWKDSVPDHRKLLKLIGMCRDVHLRLSVRWDPHREDHIFFHQSVFLWGAFYGLQINVHRTFIPSPRTTSVNSLPSLAICTNAARSCMHILDVQFSRSDRAVGVAPHQVRSIFPALTLVNPLVDRMPYSRPLSYFYSTLGVIIAEMSLAKT